MKVLIDNQIFEQQKFGGISRYFNMLERDNDYVQKMKLFAPHIPKENSFYQIVQTKVNRTLFNKQKSIPNKYDLIFPLSYNLCLNKRYKILR